MDYYISKCANCGQIKDILCTINDEPCCEDCFNNVLLQGMYDNFKEEIMKKETPYLMTQKSILLTKMEKLKV